jgi:hypothetical protein
MEVLAAIGGNKGIRCKPASPANTAGQYLKIDQRIRDPGAEHPTIKEF